MNLLELRKQFATLSGRYDLVNDDNTDNGADFFINGGQRHLDHLTQFTKAQAVNYQVLRPGDWSFYLFHCRSVERVSFLAHQDYNIPHKSRDSTVMREIPRMSIRHLRAHFGGASKGTPQAYALVTSRGTQDTMRANDFEMFDAMTNLADIVMGQYYDKVGVIIYPVPDRALQFETEGLFYTPPMTEDEDNSYWSMVNPQLLLQAALREVEIFHRNTTGVRDWDQAITSAITLIEHDHVLNESQHVTKMRG